MNDAAIYYRKECDYYMRFAKSVVKHRVAILILTVLLMVPSIIGMTKTRINYDMLNYLPSDMDTVIGQNELMEDFGKGAFSFIIVEDMPQKDVADLKKQIEEIDHVESVIWYDSLIDISVPMELLPKDFFQEFNTNHSTMMAVFFNTSTSEDETMDAIRAATKMQLTREEGTAATNKYLKIGRFKKI